MPMSLTKHIKGKIAPDNDDDARTGPICECVSCDACDCSGGIWVDMTGRYLGKNRSDDLDEMEQCPNCNGRGITEVCQSCAESEEAL